MTLGMKLRFPLVAFSMALISARMGYSVELLHLDFNDATKLGAQPGGLPSGVVHGAAIPSSAFPGSADFGPQGGWIQIPDFVSPRGPYSIEARFLIRNYGSENARFIADILSTATWDVGPPQGLELKVGGGYLYPTLPRDAYRTEAEWTSAQGGYSHIDRGRFSGCFVAFSMARKDSQRDWKAVYTDRCIERNAWTHLVGIWDGSNMRIYLNGTEATDKWRVQGLESPPQIDSLVDAYAGAGFDAPTNRTYLDGIVDYVKVEAGALSESDIHKRYKDNFDPLVHDSLCVGVLKPHYPEAGQVCTGKLDLDFKLVKHGACTDTAYAPKVEDGDSAEIEISKDPAFTDLSYHKVTPVTGQHLEADDFPGLAGYQGALYWRVRLVHGHSAASAKTSARTLAKSSATTPDDWSLSRPLVMDFSAPVAAWNRKSAQKQFHFQWQSGLFLTNGKTGSAPVVIDSKGKQLAVPARRLGE